MHLKITINSLFMTLKIIQNKMPCYNLLQTRMGFLFTCMFVILSSTSQAQSDTLLAVHSLSIYFDSDVDVPNEKEWIKLDSLFAQLNTSEFDSVRVTAHTDKKGSEAYNERLSYNRAQSVCNYLDSLVDSNRLICEFKGERIPIIDKSDELSLKLNRRAVVEVLKRFPVQFIDGQVVDAEDEKGQESTLFMHNRYWSETFQTDSIGRFRIKVPRDEAFGIDVSANNYLLASRLFARHAFTDKSKIEISLERLAVGKSFDLGQMYFHGNVDVLKTVSFRALQVLKAFMTSNPTACIEIKGHINRPNSSRTKPNTRDHDLSIARARRICNFLLESGVTEDRMLYKGYGNWYMVYPTTRFEHEMARNRRVEIEIIDCEKSSSEKNDSLKVNSVFYIFKPQAIPKN